MTSARIGLSAVSGAPHRDLRTPQYRRFDSCLLIVGAVESHLLPTGQRAHPDGLNVKSRVQGGRQSHLTARPVSNAVVHADDDRLARRGRMTSGTKSTLFDGFLKRLLVFSSKVRITKASLTDALLNESHGNLTPMRGRKAP
jgi:hypothetical protein